jgi:N-acetylglucosaminyldiphosphoundecaprenol N-acetyl-beta-D-mannosaminyltransferase
MTTLSSPKKDKNRFGSSTRISILDIPFDKFIHKEAFSLVKAHLKNPNTKAFFIATPNPEMLLEARKNEYFKKTLQSTDLNIADGSGILLASKILGNPLPERVTGVDFMLSICRESVNMGAKIFLLGAQEGIAEKAKEKLEGQFPGISIVSTYSGSPDPINEQKICSLINESGADILFVAFGAPKQELWLARNLENLPKIKITMGVGGAFDFIAGVRKRAPVWMRKLWLEWLFRLIQEPKRLKRIFNATVKFPLVFLRNLYSNKRKQF